MPEKKITATEARQATVRPRAMVLVLFAWLFIGSLIKKAPNRLG